MKIRHFICEDIRQEVNGKVSIAGLYPDDCLLLPEIIEQRPDVKEFTAIDRLMILVNAGETSGTKKVVAEVFKPDGSLHAVAADVGTIEFVEDRSANIIMNFSGFPVPFPGTYIIKVHIGDHQHEIPLKIILDK